MKSRFVQDNDFFTMFTSLSIFSLISSSYFFSFLVSQDIPCVTCPPSDPLFPSISSLTYSKPKKEPTFLRHSKITTSFAATSLTLSRHNLNLTGPTSASFLSTCHRSSWAAVSWPGQGRNGRPRQLLCSRRTTLTGLLPKQPEQNLERLRKITSPFCSLTDDGHRYVELA